MRAYLGGSPRPAYAYTLPAGRRFALPCETPLTLFVSFVFFVVKKIELRIGADGK